MISTLVPSLMLLVTPATKASETSGSITRSKALGQGWPGSGG
jgi:hypothetical protein